MSIYKNIYFIIYYLINFGIEAEKISQNNFVRSDF